MMEKILLDFSDCKNAFDMYNVLHKSFAFPYKWGKNLSALFDAMSYAWDGEICLVIRGTHALPGQCRSAMDGILAVFQDVHDETPNVTFTVES